MKIKKHPLNRKYTLVLLLFVLLTSTVFSQNPIVPNKGLNDPHIHVFDNIAYVYASHDSSIDNKNFVMQDWWVWSSPDLVNWTQRSILKPEETCIGKPFDGCWATDAASKNGKYYFYFSEENRQTGVVVGDSPVGPWKDVLGKPLLASDLTPTDEYDVTIFEDKGEHYIIFGVWDYYIARLNDDMISLAEAPRKIVVHNPEGPAKKGNTDDKSYLHKYKNKFYLSWGAFYATSDNVYGPYDYKGVIINQESFAKGYDKPTWPNGFLQGRHGNFFEWNNQWYFTYCDISQTGNRYFRDTFISYVHYKENGEIAPIRVDGIGVGNYDANQKTIEAEDYFKASRALIKECPEGGFMINGIINDDYLVYPNSKNLDKKSKIAFRIANIGPVDIELRNSSPQGKLLAKYCLKKSNGAFYTSSQILPKLESKTNLCLVFKTKKDNRIQFNSFSFQ